MPRVSFTPHLRKHLACDTIDVPGGTVAEALEAVFARQPEMRGYLLDDLGRVRLHVMIFVDDRPLGDRDRLTDALRPDSEIHVMQALSGG
jgi:hypothetical protein